MPIIDRLRGTNRGVTFNRHELDIVDRALCLAAAVIRDDIASETYEPVKADLIKQEIEFRTLMDWVGENKLAIDR